jgi:hypothetical protein
MTTETAATSPAATPTASDILAAPSAAVPLTPEAARQAIESRKSDKEFYKRLSSPDAQVKATALEEWGKLHEAAFPAPPQLTPENIKDLPAHHQAIRAAQMMEQGIAAVRQMGVTDPKALDEIRRQQPVAAAEQEFAREEIARLKRDKVWVRKYLDGDREASAAFTRLHQIISLPTAKTATTYPVK